MKDWTNLKADANYWMKKHYNKGRDGQKIKAVVIHHNASNLSLKECYEVWQKREASAHYQVDANGRIGQYVHDKDTAWAAGKANKFSISIEHANNKMAPDWTISEATLDNGAHLTAAICKYYKLGEPEWGVNVYPHNQFNATACPGALAGKQRAAYMTRAKNYYREMTGKQDTKHTTGTPAPRITEPLILDAWFGTQSIRRLQQVMGTPIDGIISGQLPVNRRYVPNAGAGWEWRNYGAGSMVIKAWQKRVGATPDGLFGCQSVKATQKYLSVTVDGYAGAMTMRAWQKWLNGVG